MRAALVPDLGRADSVTVVNRAEPVPACGQLIVDVQAASVNYPDVLMIGEVTSIPSNFHSCRAANSLELSVASGRTRVTGTLTIACAAYSSAVRSQSACAYRRLCSARFRQV